jgi:hypothetical protein
MVVTGGVACRLAAAPATGVGGPPAVNEPSAPVSIPAAPSPSKLAVVKAPPTTASTFPWLPDTLRVLERFPVYHTREWHSLEAGGEALGYYGAGDRAGAVAQARALLAIAYLTADTAYDPRPSGVTTVTLRDQALRSLRHLLRTHTSGSLDRISGGRWGGDEAALRVVPPLAAASRLLASRLSPKETEAVERAVRQEADRLLEVEPAAGRPRESRALENATRAACLAWAAALFPEHANAPRWEYQVRWLAVNSLSAPQDRAAEATVDSRRVSEWVTTENLLPDYLLESGGAVNPDALLQTLASLSDAYYAYTSRGRPVPEALTHHFEDAWGAVFRLWLGGHRFARPAGSLATTGGDLALFPVLALLEWVGSEPSVARRIERSCFQALEAEQIALGDGRFLGDRSGAEMEAEAAAALALAGLIHRQHGRIVAPAAPESLRAALAGAWTSPAAALAAARSPHCFASWTWRGIGRPAQPTGLFIPLDAEELLMEGPDQFVGSFELQGFTAARQIHHRERTVEGGFTATGQIEEGQKDGQAGLHHFVAFAALPAERIAVAFDLTVAAQEVTVVRSEGLRLRLRADPLGKPRTVQSEEGALALPLDQPGPVAPDRAVTSPWLNVEDRLGLIALYSQEPFTVRGRPTAGGPPGGAGEWESGVVAVIDTPFTMQPAAVRPGQIVRDTVLLLVAGDTATTTRLARSGAVLPTGRELVRAAVVPTATGSRYLVAANFGLKETTVTLRPPGAAPLADLRLAPLDTLVLPLPR